MQLSESDSQDRKSSPAAAVSTVASTATPSPVSSVAEVSQAQLQPAPQPPQPSVSPQTAAELLDSKGTSPAPENKESAEFVHFLIIPFCVD